MRRTTTSKRSIRAVLAASVLLLSCPAVAAAQLSEISTHLRSQVEQGLTVDLDEEAPRWDRRMKPARRMKLHHHSSGSSGYTGCLGYNATELSSMWIFRSQAPNCTYNTGGEGESSGGGGSGGGGGSSGGGGGSSGGGGDDDASGGGGGGGDDDASGGGGGGGDADSNGSDGDDAGGDGSDDDSNNNDDDPVVNFNVEECDTFASLWIWDLSLTCDDVDTFENCECTFASELMDMGMLTCDDVSRCPDQCGVCMTCMRLLGCANAQPSSGATGFVSSNITFYLIAAAIGSVVIAGVAYASSRNKRDENSLGEQLMDDSGFEPTVFLAPSGEFDAPGAPFVAAPQAQFEAAALAAVVAIQGGESNGGSNNGGGVWLAPMNTGDDEK